MSIESKNTYHKPTLVTKVSKQSGKQVAKVTIRKGAPKNAFKPDF